MIKDEQRIRSSQWFQKLRDALCNIFEDIEEEYANMYNARNGIERSLKIEKFQQKPWSREGGGGGVMATMRGNVFEKVGVNISTVYGEFSPEFRKHMPGADLDANFYATGISVVAHMRSPLVPAAHFNTRYIETAKTWFGGGGDLTPIFEDQQSADIFHQSFKNACDLHDPSYYNIFKKKCDEYFYLKHRQEPRGVGGIFYDYLNTENFENDFMFTQDVGKAFMSAYPKIVRANMQLPWSDEQRAYQLIKRGRYVEFNLLYDRGTTFGLMTGGNVEAILMSMPPVVHWP